MKFNRAQTVSAFCILSALFIGARVFAQTPAPSTYGQTPVLPVEKKSPLLQLWETWFPGFSIDSLSNGTQDESANAGNPTAFDELLSPSTVLTAEQMEGALAWQEPNFENQSGALGWTSTTFTTPVKMRERVAFWRDIYAKYTTSQGVLHDPSSLVVYTRVDFPAARDSGGMGDALSARLRESMIREKKSDVNARLLRLQERLQAGQGAEGLNGEDLRIWKAFEQSPDPLRFLTASSRMRFQLGQKDRFLLGIYYSGRYLREMEKIFKEEGLPIELTRLPFVESSFNLSARSKVGASGIWQFMPRTAKAYMKVNREVDDRNDPLVSTKAAARLLRGNYQMLRSWPLALTGYNHGPSGVRNVVQKAGTNDIAEIVSTYSSKTFGFASQNFYACFLAALEVEREAKTIFREPKWSPVVESGEVRAPSLMSWATLVKMFDGNETMAMEYNPHLLSRARDSRPRIPGGTRLRVPVSRVEVAKLAFTGRISPSNLAKKLEEAPIKKSLEALVPTGEEPAAPKKSEALTE